ncbi:MAG TPA: DUF1549 and DUF1553 domain-containing protein [Gemmataceae bacterium]|jgi:hypothetical protein|nr:DUF1549 and DUF1553 domain-containing protein [Gemmataceae bacterium]
MRWQLSFLALGLVLLAGPGLWADPPKPADSKPDPYALAAKIDKILLDKMKDAGVEPAPAAADDEFLRRVMVDVVGRIPLTSEYYNFMGDKSAAKRHEMVDKLLDTPGYVNHFTNIWRTLLMPEASTDFNIAYMQIGFDNWLQRQMRENKPYDQFVRDLITAPIGQRRNEQYVDVFSGRENPLAFFAAKDAKPENIAAATARIFLGINIECAQCHNHPFARWSREQFWGTAAFFAGIERQGTQFYQPMREVYDRREISIPNDPKEKVVQASFLDGKEPQWKFQTSSRNTLAEWITSDDNPFFARATVNRYWYIFFGVGIVDPVDDFNDENKPSHPELLDEMAKAFIAAKYDTKFLIRAITATQAYQRTSALANTSQTADMRLFARMPIKAMSGDQLFDSVATAVSYQDQFRGRPAIIFGGNTPRTQFMSKFNSTHKPTEAQTSILQALMLMNGDFVNSQTNPDNVSKSLEPSTFGAIVDAPFMSTERKVEAMYIAALGRKPNADELQKLVKHIETGDAAKQRQRIGDAFWTLLNSVEFRVNH